VKAGGRQNNPPAGNPIYIGNRREMEEWNSVLIGSSIGLGSTSEPIGDKNRS
jgi:hypothetical protein